MRKDFCICSKLPPAPEGVTKKPPLGDLGVDFRQVSVWVYNILIINNLHLIICDYKYLNSRRWRDRFEAPII